MFDEYNSGEVKNRNILNPRARRLYRFREQRIILISSVHKLYDVSTSSAYFQSILNECTLKPNAGGNFFLLLPHEYYTQHYTY